MNFTADFTAADIRNIVHAVTQRTGAPVRDEDLEQEAALRAIEAFRNCREVRSPRAYLASVVRNAISDYWRKRYEEYLMPLDRAPLALSPRFEDDLDRRRQVDRLRSALARIDAGKRETLELFYNDGFSVAEIARLQQKTASAVKMELLRARRRLSQILRIRPTAAAAPGRVKVGKGDRLKAELQTVSGHPFGVPPSGGPRPRGQMSPPSPVSAKPE